MSERWSVFWVAAKYGAGLGLAGIFFYLLGWPVWALAAFFCVLFVFIALLAALGWMRAVDLIVWLMSLGIRGR